MSADHPEFDLHGHREKRWVALSSLLAAVVLTATKIVVGLWTNSLGILSEAAHSALDLAAAAITVWTVRTSGQPADAEHHYGHGKFENLSALVQTVLLWIVCGWIIFEGCRRLFGVEDSHVDANVWAFGVIVLSIVVDLSRSRALAHAAKKYRSQALEADALHFSTDVWSSLVVLLGLFCAAAGQRFGIGWLHRADAAAALAVAGIVIVVSLRLGKRAVDELVDAVPAELRDRVERATAAVAGVLAVSRVRLRRSGPAHFVDLTVKVERTATLERAHALTDAIEQAVEQALPGADVVVHIEPQADSGEDLAATIQWLADRMGLKAHSVHVYQQRSGRAVELHLEVDRRLTLDEAHLQSSRFEAALREASPDVRRIVTHIEPSPHSEPQPAQRADEPAVREAIERFVAGEDDSVSAHAVSLNTIDGRLGVSLHLRLDAELSITAAHELSERLERHLRENVPQLDRVVIHVEPNRGD